MNDLTHVDEAGRARMVDVTPKPVQHRRAVATGRIGMSKTTVARIRDNEVRKGDVLTVAEVAGVQAAKRTAELVPLCHPLPLGRIRVTTELEADAVRVTADVVCVAQTGVEMEALTAVSVALLTVYDMCKAVDRRMRIGDIQLLEKEKSDPS